LAPSVQPESVPTRWHILAPLLALSGGVLGVLGAAYTEITHGSFLSGFIGTPIIEEIFKPLGVYIILAKWPAALRGRLYTAILAMLAGIAFATIENWIYIHVYIKDPSPETILWRYTVCTAMHAGCSFIFGLGINSKLKAMVKGEVHFLSFGKRFFIPAIALHAIYNLVMTITEFGFTFFTKF
jgi:RsiW-degrading membrane proteinase PrsW (M82 family)